MKQKTKSLVLACRFFDRVMGLKPYFDQECVLMIVPCRSVHTFGMKASVDVAFFDNKGRICVSYTDLSPGHVKSCRGAQGVLERFTPCEKTDNNSWFTDGEELWLCLKKD